MKIGLYSPYIPKHFGGGEKHMLTSAWYLAQKHDVEVLIPSNAGAEKTWQAKYESLFDLDLSRVRFVVSPLADRTGNPLSTWNITHAYDAFLYLTDGSLFLSGAKRNILHIQIPYTFAKNQPLERLKLRSWNVKNANSQFTKKVVEKAWKTQIEYLHYPYVKIPQKTAVKKSKDIIAVGRFIPPGHASHSKGQEVLIRTFGQACEHGQLKDSALHLVGTIEPGQEAQDFVADLRKQAKGLPIKFWHDIPQTELEALYDKCSLFWHAAGWQIDDQAQPEKVEHFGMTTIEAMARGCVPIVLEKGGSKEIITDGKNGFFFGNEDDLREVSEKLLRQTAMLTKAQEAARVRAQDFSLEKFCQTLDTMIGSA